MIQLRDSSTSEPIWGEQTTEVANEETIGDRILNFFKGGSTPAPAPIHEVVVTQSSAGTTPGTKTTVVMPKKSHAAVYWLVGLLGAGFVGWKYVLPKLKRK